MSAFSYDARTKTFAKTQNRFSNCFIEQIVSDSQQRCFELRYVLRFRFQLIELFQHGSPHVVVQWVKVWAVWWPGVFVNEVWAVFAGHSCAIFAVCIN